MHLVLSVVALVVTVLVVAGLCKKIDLPAPLVLIAVGIGASYLPFVPETHLSSEVVLLGFLPPLLYSAALSTSLVDFSANRAPILLLSVGLVVFTAAGVAVVVHWLLPDISWLMALAIGAVVAPPDAIAATAIGRRIGLPRRIVTILEGESLLNDATALVTLRTALAAAIAWETVAAGFLMAAGGGVLVGLVFFFVISKVRRHVTDQVIDSGISFVTPFAAYIAAEELHFGESHASGVIAVVVAGLLLGHTAPITQTASSRIAERLNWRSIGFLLESAVFLLIGLQARWIVGEVSDNEIGWGRIAALCVATLVAVIALRMIWMLGTRALLLKSSSKRDRPWSYSILLGWAGMRGVVTLAAAFVIPEDTPNREILLLIAFTVTAGTLFLQGLTLPRLAKALDVRGPDPAEDALARANLLHTASQAGLARLHELEEDDPHSVNEVIRQRLERRDNAAWERMGGAGDETPSEVYNRRRREMIDAERRRVLEVRSSGSVAHEVVEEVLAMLDVEESMLDYVGDERERMRAAMTTSAAGSGKCGHLQAAVEDVEPRAAGQCDACLAIGSTWVHLRMCEACGNVGCCDSSPNRHATRHFEETGHPVMRSAEPGESWRWCFVDQVTG